MPRAGAAAHRRRLSRPGPTANPSKEASGQPREPSEIVYGLRAGLAVFARRREDIVRVARARGSALGHGGGDASEFAALAALAQWASSKQVPFIEMSEDELNRFAGSTHHEGLCIVTRPRRWLSTSELHDALVHGRGLALALDRVRNPYNVGAMLRTAAFFGLDALVLGAPAPNQGLDPTAVRVAEGGLEHLKVARTTDLADTLARLRARGIRVVGADGRAKANAAGYAFPRPMLLAVGHEREGLGERVRAQCDALVSIQGCGAVESLNVATAAGVLMAEVSRAYPAAPALPKAR